jgi:hypothetical protein
VGEGLETAWSRRKKRTLSGVSTSGSSAAAYFSFLNAGKRSAVENTAAEWLTP